MTEIERQIARQCARDLIDAGYYVTVYDGEEDVLKDSVSVKAILAKMGTTDEDYFYVRKKANDGAWIGESFVRFIYGNDGPDVINDYGTSLERVLAETNALADRLAE